MGLVVTVLVAIGVYCAASLVVHGPDRERAAFAEANHVVMAAAMVAMLLPATVDLVPPTAGLVLFAAVTAAWVAALLVLRARRRPLGALVGGARCCAHPAHLALINLAMVVMYAGMLPASGAPAMAGMGDMAGMGGMPAAAPSPLLTVLGVGLAAYLLVHAGAGVVSVVGVRAPRPVAAGGRLLATAPWPARVATSPRWQAGCQAAMSAVMGVLLLPLS